MTIKKVLIDTNLFIQAVSSAETTESLAQKNAAKHKLRELLSNEQVHLVVTPLIRYEVLRGVRSDVERSELEAILQYAQTLDITHAMGDLATRLYALRVKEGMNANKYNFDLFHFATAKTLNCDLETHDNGFAELERLYQAMQSPH